MDLFFSQFPDCVCLLQDIVQSWWRGEGGILSKCNGIVYFCRKFMQNYTYKFPNMAKMHFGRLLLPSCRELWLANCRTFCKGSSLAPAVRAACVHRVFVPITHTTTLHGHGERCASRAQRAPSRARPWDVRTRYVSSSHNRALVRIFAPVRFPLGP